MKRTQLGYATSIKSLSEANNEQFLIPLHATYAHEYSRPLSIKLQGNKNLNKQQLDKIIDVRQDDLREGGWVKELPCQERVDTWRRMIAAFGCEQSNCGVNITNRRGREGITFHLALRRLTIPADCVGHSTFVFRMDCRKLMRG